MTKNSPDHRGNCTDGKLLPSEPDKGRGNFICVVGLPLSRLYRCSEKDFVSGPGRVSLECFQWASRVNFLPIKWEFLKDLGIIRKSTKNSAQDSYGTFLKVGISRAK